MIDILPPSDEVFLSKIYLENICKTFDVKSVSAIDNLTLTLEPHQKTAILGASGTGKSTLLKIVSGEIVPDSGFVSLETGEELGQVISCVPQDFHFKEGLNVAEQIQSYCWGFSQLESYYRAREVIDLFSLHYKDDAQIHELSFGQIQRLAFACAIARKPRWVLMDEPFSNLDELLKRDLKRDLKRVFEKENIASVLVTHDTRDILGEADHLILLQDGEVCQQGNPLDVYHHPRDSYSARFLGRANLVATRILQEHQETCSIRGPFGELEMPKSSHFRSGRSHAFHFFRPEAVHIHPDGQFEAVFASCEYLPYCEIWELHYKQGKIFALTRASLGEDVLPGESVRFDINFEQTELIPT